MTGTSVQLPVKAECHETLNLARKSLLGARLGCVDPKFQQESDALGTKDTTFLPLANRTSMITEKNAQ